MNKQEHEHGKKIVANSKEKTLSLYENEKLQQIFKNVCFGKNGVTKAKNEGDGCTPLGTFPIGFAFGTEILKTSYPYYELKDNIYWISDPHSPYYNKWVEVSKKEKTYSYPYMSTCKKIDWQEAEHLIDYKIQYQLALVIEYNVNPIQKNKGSAIFLHVKNKEYTAGCIAVNKEEMLTIMKWLENGSATIEIC